MNKNKNRKIIILLVAAVLLVASGLAAWKVFFSKSEEVPQETEQLEDVSFSPPTEDEVSDGESRPNKLDEDQQNPQPTTSTDNKKSVRVAITNWGEEGNRFEVGAYANTFESSGSCSLKLKKGSVILTGNSSAVQSASTMSCGSLSVDNRQISKGNWTATVTYSSAKSYGSLTQQIEVE